MERLVINGCVVSLSPIQTLPLQKITLTLVDIDTYKKGSSCNRKSDKILVSDKPDSSYDVVRTWCGDALPSDKTFTSTKKCL